MPSGGSSHSVLDQAVEEQGAWRRLPLFASLMVLSPKKWLEAGTRADKKYAFSSWHSIQLSAR